MPRKNGEANSDKILAGNLLRTPVAIIVLGVRLAHSEASPQMLFRLALAYQLLIQYPEAVCIVSGGRYGQCSVSEAEKMEEWLLRKGIPHHRIRLEDKALNTQENIKYSKTLLDTEFGSISPVMICTEGYHLYRSNMIAKSLGLSPIKWSAPFICKDQKAIARVKIMVREALAWVKDYVVTKLPQKQ